MPVFSILETRATNIGVCKSYTAIQNLATQKLRSCQNRAPVFVDERASDGEIKKSIVTDAPIAAIIREINRISA